MKKAQRKPTPRARKVPQEVAPPRRGWRPVHAFGAMGLVLGLTFLAWYLFLPEDVRQVLGEVRDWLWPPPPPPQEVAQINPARPPGPAPEGMVWVPGGSFWMGSEDFPDAVPIHLVRVDGFWMDR